MKRKWMILAVLSTAMLLCSACGRKNGQVTPTPAPTKEGLSNVTLAPTNAPEATKAPEPTKEPDATPVPTMEPQEMPVPTAEPTPVESQTPTSEPTQEAKPTDSAQLTYATVTPVPQSAVVDIKGTMTVETYPKVDGSTATLPLSEAVFMAATGESAEVATEHVVHTKTTNSYTRLYNKEVDLLIVYEPAQSIVERMQTEPLCIKPIGLDALVFMANQANPVQSLTMEQLVDIYSGKVGNWSEVGGLDKNLLAFQRPLGSGSQTLMQKLVMGDVEMVTGDNVFRYYTMSDILEGMLSYNGEDNTLGYSVFYYANNMYFEKDLKFMAVNGVLPSTETIYDGSYILDNAFYAVVRTDEPADSNARKIFDWLTGNDGQQLVLDLGYVPVQMPEGAVITNKQTEQPDKTEILATEPLPEGKRFVAFNPQNITSDLYYGDVTVYDADWKEMVSFYNVTLEGDVTGIYGQRYLPLGQIRQNTAGEQVVYYGIYDLENLEYSVHPSYYDLFVLNADRGYYAVPDLTTVDESGRYTCDYQIINGAGEVILEHTRYEDWLMLHEFGNGYMETVYDYANYEENGQGHYYYDENLTLKKVFCERAHMIPDDAEKQPGVDYYLIENGGCVVDENAEMLINDLTFLSVYGDGVDMDCNLQMHYVQEAEDGMVYEILYKNQRYVVDKELNLLYQGDRTEKDGENYYFYGDYYVFSDRYGKSSFYTYDGEPILMSDGSVPDVITWQRWGDNRECVMYMEKGDRYIVESGVPGQAVLRYPIFRETENINWADIEYLYNGYLVKQENYWEKVPAKSDWGYDRYISAHTLYHNGKELARTKGFSGSYITALEDGYSYWRVSVPEELAFDQEALYYEEYGQEQIIYCSDYFFLKDGELVSKIENAHMFSYGNGVCFLLKGNYMYAVGYDGTVYLKALRSFMGLD